MLISCTTKGCMEQSEAKLNKETGEVICESCGKPIEGITEFAKKTLLSIGQVLRSPRTAFQAQCHQCKAARPLYIEEGRAFCKTCGTQVHVSTAFLKGLEIHIQNENKE
jgi:uncharacterized Zn finger protein (UPF0148 family)